MNVVRYAANTQGRDFIVGDIHGMFDLLRSLIANVGFNPDVDRLFALGDLVDRGPQSAEAYYWLELPWFHSIRGNHEQICIDVVRHNGDQMLHLINGGSWFYYSTEIGSLQDMGLSQEMLVEKFEKLPLAIELELPNGDLLGLIHAEPDGMQWGGVVRRLNENDDNSIHAAMWGRNRVRHQITTPINDVHTVVVGHTVVRTPSQLGNVLYLDTGACFGARLSMLQVDTGEVFFASAVDLARTPS